MLFMEFGDRLTQTCEGIDFDVGEQSNRGISSPNLVGKPDMVDLLGLELVR